MSEEFFEQPGSGSDDGLRAPDLGPLRAAAEQEELAEAQARLADGEYILTAAADSFLHRVTWEGDVATGWRPHDDPQSPVRMQPETRFGRPAVKGISTEILWEHELAGEMPEEIAAEFGLSDDDVRWALAYETSVQAYAA